MGPGRPRPCCPGSKSFSPSTPAPARPALPRLRSVQDQAAAKLRVVMNVLVGSAGKAQRGRVDRPSRAGPPQIRTCGTTASGSSSSQVRQCELPSPRSEARLRQGVLAQQPVETPPRQAGALRAPDEPLSPECGLPPSQRRRLRRCLISRGSVTQPMGFLCTLHPRGRPRRRNTRFRRGVHLGRVGSSHGVAVEVLTPTRLPPLQACLAHCDSQPGPCADAWCTAGACDHRWPSARPGRGRGQAA